MKKKNVNVNAGDNNGWTPLHMAVSSGHTETIRLLEKNGAV